MTNCEWMIATKSKEEIVTAIVYNCPYGTKSCVYANDEGFDCTDCWARWLQEERKNV